MVESTCGKNLMTKQKGGFDQFQRMPPYEAEYDGQCDDDATLRNKMQLILQGWHLARWNTTDIKRMAITSEVPPPLEGP